MGKIRSNKFRLHQRSAELSFDSAIEESDLFTKVKNALTSPKPSERVVGANLFINSILSDLNVLKPHLNELIRILSPLLNDRVESVCSIVADVLR